MGSKQIDFHDVNFAIGHDGDYNYYNDSLIEVNQDNVVLDFYNCTFDAEQYDLLYGGDLVCDGNGSAIYIDGNNCTIDGHNSTVFKTCITNGYYGGAICDDGYENTIIRNCEFKDCECTGLGGAIYTEGTNCIVDNCKFSGCTAPKGGSNIYSWYNGEVHVVDCKNADGSPIDESTCFNCDFDADTYMRQNFPTCVRHPAYPEEGYYIIRSAVDPNYGLAIQGGKNLVILNPVDEPTVFRLEKEINGNGYKIFHNNNILVSGFLYSTDQVTELPDKGHLWVGSNWNFESDAPGGDDHYYIHAVEGVCMEAGLENGGMPWPGTIVQYTSYSGSMKQVWVLEKVDAPTGSTISEGNGWIIGIGAVVIVGGIAAIVISKKKKQKAVLAEDETVEVAAEPAEKTEE